MTVRLNFESHVRRHYMMSLIFHTLLCLQGSISTGSRIIHYRNSKEFPTEVDAVYNIDSSFQRLLKLKGSPAINGHFHTPPISADINISGAIPIVICQITYRRRWNDSKSCHIHYMNSEVLRGTRIQCVQTFIGKDEDFAWTISWSLRMAILCQPSSPRLSCHCRALSRLKH